MSWLSIPPSIGSPTILPFLPTSMVVGNAIISEAYFPASEDASMERLRYLAPWLSRTAALSIDGNIYPCFRWLPHTQSGKEDAFVCGSADRGMYNKDAFRRVREGAYRASCTKEEKCRTCEYESSCPYCIGGCFAEFGEFRRTTHICRITKIQCAAAEKYWQAYDMQGGNGK